MMLKNMTPSPLMWFYLDYGEQILVDVEIKSSKEITEHIKKTKQNNMGKNEETLQNEEQEKKLSCPVHFGLKNISWGNASVKWKGRSFTWA